MQTTLLPAARFSLFATRFTATGPILLAFFNDVRCLSLNATTDCLDAFSG